MDENALAYRLQRGFDKQDEQMALLVQRVSGSYKKSFFFPDFAGVGVSHNAFVWKPELNPQAGMVRLVFGLGTRAVERVEDDYPRTIALDQPLLSPYDEWEDARIFSQHNVDVLDISQNCLRTVDLFEVLYDKHDVKLDLIMSPDLHTDQSIDELGMNKQKPWIMAFKKLLSDSNFTQIMQKMLKTLENHYQHPVDIEFTINFVNDNAFKINVVQCKTLQIRGLKENVQILVNIEPQKILFSSVGYTMGGSISQPIKRIIYVDPETYGEIPISQKYSIARLVGKLNKQITSREVDPTILLGPGRWGTITPGSGIPVNFAEINRITALVEIACEDGNLMPELSFGTNFFQDLVESDIFYVALFPLKENVVFNKDRLLEMPNLLADFLPEERKYEDILKVYEVTSGQLQIISYVVSQKVVCFFT